MDNEDSFLEFAATGTSKKLKPKKNDSSLIANVDQISIAFPTLDISALKQKEDLKTVPWIFRSDCCAMFDDDSEAIKEQDMYPEGLRCYIPKSSSSSPGESESSNLSSSSQKDSDVPHHTMTSGIFPSREYAQFCEYSDINTKAYRCHPVYYQYFVRSTMLWFLCSVWVTELGVLVLTRSNFVVDLVDTHRWLLWTLAGMMLVVTLLYYFVQFDDASVLFQRTYIVFVVTTITVTLAALETHNTAVQVLHSLTVVSVIFLMFIMFSMQTSVPFNFFAAAGFVLLICGVLTLWLVYLPYNVHGNSLRSWLSLSDSAWSILGTLLTSCFLSIYILFKIRQISMEVRYFDVMYAVYRIYVDLSMLLVTVLLSSIFQCNWGIKSVRDRSAS